MASSSLKDVLHIIESGDEATCVLEGNQMERLEWMLREQGFERDGEASGLSIWIQKLPEGLGRYRMADVVYISGREINSKLFKRGFTVFSQSDAMIRTAWTVWSEGYATASMLDRDH